MTSHCMPCDRVFGSQEAFNQHVRSKAHATRRRANQLDLDQKLASQTSKSNQKAFSTQPQPNYQKIFVSQGYPLGSQQHCTSCNKSFKDKTALNQHLQNSKVHKAAVLPPSQIQTIQLQITPQKSSISDLHRRIPSLGDAIASCSRPSQPPNSDGDKYHKQKSPWSVFSMSENIVLLEQLSRHCHSPEDLRRNKYLLSPYSDANIAGLRKCKKCGRLAKNSQSNRCCFHPGKLVTVTQNNQRHYTCCQTTNMGCASAPTHEYKKAQHADKYQSFASSPAATLQKPKFQAISLDCEMAQVKGLRSEVVLICAVDYFTGAVLLNRLVDPGERVRDWRTEIHGVTDAAMKKAILQGYALAGWKEARAEVWKLIDQNTILVGHALQHDLDVLRMVHTRVVDSAILARNAIGMNRQWGLQRLCKELLSLEIRNNKGGVHDCLEDVLATREVVLYCTRNKQKLEAWAEANILKLKREEEQRKAARQKLASKRAHPEKVKAGSSSKFMSASNEYESDETEILRWSDIAEDCGWPHPDTGYDPWSD